MVFRKAIGVALGFLAAVVSQTGPANADSVLGWVDASYNNNSPTGTARIDFDFGGTNDDNIHVYTGRSNFTIHATSDNLSAHFPETEFQAFCVDFQQEIFSNTRRTWELVQLSDVPYPWTASGHPDGMGAQRSAWVQRLFEQRYSSIDTGTDEQREINATAFQIATWDLIYDADDNDVTSGTHFHVNEVTSGHDSNVYDLADAWVKDAKKAGLAYSGDVYALRSEDRQDFAVLLEGFEPTGPPVAAPMPAAAWTGMLLMGGLAVARRIKQRGRNADV